MANIILSTNSNTGIGNLIDRKTEYYQAGLQGSSNTQKAYANDLKQFREWCILHSVESLPASAETLANYVTHIAGKFKFATITRHIAAISKLHYIAYTILKLPQITSNLKYC
jgi:site-specific recombinase XerD